MQNKLTIFLLLTSVFFLLPFVAQGQGSAVNTYSPYSMYGIGDLFQQGTGNLRAMGGAGIAYRGTHLTPVQVNFNYLNPASYSSMPRKAFIFNIGLEGANYYLESGDKKSSYTGFNVRDIGVLFPLGRRIGFGVSVTPFSSVGYRLEDRLINQEIQGTVGTVTKYYQGDGDVTQVKAGLGLQVTKRLSLGLEMIYYKGYIDRIQEVYFSSEFGEIGFKNTYVSISEDVSRMSLYTGFQYNLISTSERVLTLGGTYRLGNKLKPKITQYVPSTDNDEGDVYKNTYKGNLRMANVYSGGVYYYTHKWSIGADYSFADWGSRNRAPLQQSEELVVSYRNTNTAKLGFQLTPNRYDVRHFFNRISYRAGIRYEQGYTAFQNKRIDDKAVSIGFGIPLKSSSFSNFNLGFEYGQRGTNTNGLIKINYFKFSLGFSFYGDDYWFSKQKYD